MAFFDWCFTKVALGFALTSLFSKISGLASTNVLIKRFSWSPSSAALVTFALDISNSRGAILIFSSALTLSQSGFFPFWRLHILENVVWLVL